MAQIEGLQVNITAKTDQLTKALDDTKRSLASVAQESEKQAENIGGPLVRAADNVRERYGSMAGEVAGRLASIANPAVIVSAAIAGLGAALGAYLDSIKDKTPTVDETIKMHSDLIKSLKSAYGEAAQGLDEYSKKAEKVYQTQIIADQQRALAGLNSEVRNLINSVTQAQPPMDELSMLFGDLNNKSLILRRNFEDFTGPLNQLQAQLQGGSINVSEFLDGIDKVAMQLRNEGSPTAIEYGDKLLEASKKMATLASNAGMAGPAIDVVTGAMQRGMAASKAFNDALAGIKGIAPEKISNRAQLNKFLKEGEFSAKDEEEYRRIVQEGEAAKKRIEAEEAAKAGTGGGTNDADKLAREQEMISRRLEILTSGWGKEEEQLAAHLARNLNLINLAKEKEAVDDETHKILMEGAEAEYQKRIQAIRDRVNNQALSSTASMFGSLMTLTQTFGKKGTGLAKTFGIAQALINTYVGVTKALSTLPPPASYAAAAATLASGMAQVASIRSISDSGGGGGGARSASSAGAGAMAAAANGGGGGGQPGGNSVYINLQGQSFGRDQVRDLVKQIADFQKDGGQVVFA